ncbi:uncharacterized protein H6S33_006341 [Morchella sextelata]|uniref:uncharacterized protein n=1 Tax=Morchella sextelata TaxID=1174677 RepID=UPI001D04D79B|nr:uncharacterized protein H6S33_006341 [Morchella sextelata]KAH0604673.1 hypothetical protein H6S33_006341 [Morchella sextelata]
MSWPIIIYRQETVALIRPSSRAGNSSFQSKYVLPELIYLLQAGSRKPHSPHHPPELHITVSPPPPNPAPWGFGIDKDPVMGFPEFAIML